MMGWGWMWGSMGIGMMLFMLIFWVLLIAGVVALIRWLWSGPGGGPGDEGAAMVRRELSS